MLWVTNTIGVCLAVSLTENPSDRGMPTSSFLRRWGELCMSAIKAWPKSWIPSELCFLEPPEL